MKWGRTEGLRVVPGRNLLEASLLLGYQGLWRSQRPETVANIPAPITSDTPLSHSLPSPSLTRVFLLLWPWTLTTLSNPSSSGQLQLMALKDTIILGCLSLAEITVFTAGSLLSLPCSEWDQLAVPQPARGTFTACIQLRSQLTQLVGDFSLIAVTLTLEQELCPHMETKTGLGESLAGECSSVRCFLFLSLGIAPLSFRRLFSLPHWDQMREFMRSHNPSYLYIVTGQIVTPGQAGVITVVTSLCSDSASPQWGDSKKPIRNSAGVSVTNLEQSTFFCCKGKAGRCEPHHCETAISVLVGENQAGERWEEADFQKEAGVRVWLGYRSLALRFLSHTSAPQALEPVPSSSLLSWIGSQSLGISGVRLSSWVQVSLPAYLYSITSSLELSDCSQ